jgi:hypothetical protein
VCACVCVCVYVCVCVCVCARVRTRVSTTWRCGDQEKIHVCLAPVLPVPPTPQSDHPCRIVCILRGCNIAEFAVVWVDTAPWETWPLLLARCMWSWPHVVAHPIDLRCRVGPCRSQSSIELMSRCTRCTSKSSRLSAFRLCEVREQGVWVSSGCVI